MGSSKCLNRINFHILTSNVKRKNINFHFKLRTYSDSGIKTGRTNVDAKTSHLRFYRAK